MRTLYIVLLVMMMPAGAYAQVGGHLFCDKKWFCEMTKDADGNIHPPEKGSENDYMHFLCDSSFVLSESGIVLKGKWTFDDDAMLITLMQQQINTMPEHIVFHVIDYDEGHLVIIGQEGTEGEKTAHLYTK